MGYYVNNEYPESEQALREEPPRNPILEKYGLALQQSLFKAD